MKLCECGCGELAPLAKQTRTERGQLRGQPVRFIRGHIGKTMPGGPDSKSWKGGLSMSSGYRTILRPEHPRADTYGYVREHIVIAEGALGHSLPSQAEVHHVNEIRSDNQNCNLVICEDHAYHMLLHQRKRAIEAGYPATWLKCGYCGTYDDPLNLYVSPRKTRGNKFHRACAAKRGRDRYREKQDERCTA